MESFNQELTFVFDIGDHPTVVSCWPIAAESFKLMSGFNPGSIFQMDGRKANSQLRNLRNCSSMMLLTRSHNQSLIMAPVLT